MSHRFFTVGHNQCYTTLFTTKGYRPVLGTGMNRMEQREQRVNAVGKGYRPVPDTIDVLEDPMGVRQTRHTEIMMPTVEYIEVTMVLYTQKGF